MVDGNRIGVTAHNSINWLAVANHINWDIPELTCIIRVIHEVVDKYAFCFKCVVETDAGGSCVGGGCGFACWEYVLK